jgi:DNA repair exonuclease SbcCD nuclease subunit
MDQLFQKAVVFTDAHFGRSNDDPIANQDNLDFIEWMIDRARSWGAETCLFLGDLFHSRAAVGVTSLQAALTGLEKVSGAGFKRTVLLLGNHDIARRQSREIASLNFSRHLPNVTLITNPLIVDDVMFLPWLIDDDIPRQKTRYVFAHLETIGAMMNARIPCLGGPHAVDATTFAGHDYTLSGHFHQRQAIDCPGGGQILYIGSIFPFDFSDANDHQRGITLLQWGREPIFESWSQQPLYRTLKLSEVASDTLDLRPKTTVRLAVDLPVRYEEAQEIRDSLISLYGLRKVEMRNLKTVADAVPVVVEQQSIDQIMIQGLRNIDSVGLSADRLVELYQRLN